MKLHHVQKGLILVVGENLRSPGFLTELQRETKSKITKNHNCLNIFVFSHY